MVKTIIFHIWPEALMQSSNDGQITLIMTLKRTPRPCVNQMPGALLKTHSYCTWECFGQTHGELNVPPSIIFHIKIVVVRRCHLVQQYLFLDCCLVIIQRECDGDYICTTLSLWWLDGEKKWHWNAFYLKLLKHFSTLGYQNKITTGMQC